MQTSSIYDKCDVKSHWKQYWHHKLFFIVTFLTGGEPGIKMISFEYFAPTPSLPPTLREAVKKLNIWNSTFRGLAPLLPLNGMFWYLNLD